MKKDENGSKSKKENDKDLILDVSDLGIEGAGTNEIPKEFFDEIIDARLEEIFDAVKSQLAYEGIAPKFPAGIVITGGSSKLIGINYAAQKYLSGPVRTGVPQGLYGLTDEISGPAYSAVHGMINYAVKYGINNRETGNIGNASKNISDRVKSWIKSLIP